RFEGIARAGRRATPCDFAPGSALVARDGSRLQPRADALADGGAAVWPRDGGWYRAGEGDAAPMLYVHATVALAGLVASARRAATLRLAATAMLVSPAPVAEVGSISASGRRWPCFLAFLLVVAALWWLDGVARRSESRVRIRV